MQMPFGINSLLTQQEKAACSQPVQIRCSLHVIEMRIPPQPHLQDLCSPLRFSDYVPDFGLHSVPLLLLEAQQYS